MVEDGWTVKTAPCDVVKTGKALLVTAVVVGSFSNPTCVTVALGMVVVVLLAEDTGIAK